MANLQVTEKIQHLENTIAVRKYLDRNEVALQILSKEEAEFDIHFATQSLYLVFVDHTLWCGFEREDTENVRKVLHSASEVIVCQKLKKRAESRLCEFEKFVVKHQPTIPVKVS